MQRADVASSPFRRVIAGAEDAHAMTPTFSKTPASDRAHTSALEGWVLRSLKFPALYTAIVAAGSIDVCLTGLLLALGGQEANPFADAVLKAFGFTGMVVFKYLAMGTVILACEFVADHGRRRARRLAVTLVGIHFVPLPWSAFLLSEVLS